MKTKHLVKLLIVVIGLITGVSLNSYATEKKNTPKKPHAHKENEEHGEEEKHDEKSPHAHDEGKEKDEHGHGSHEQEEGGGRFGPGKAITTASKKDGIQLSEKALKTIGLNYVSVTGEGTFKVPLKSVVFSQDEMGIYRFRNGWHKIIDVQLVSKTATEAVIKTSELNSGDQIAKDGVPLLRAAELEAWGGSGDGHGH